MKSNKVNRAWIHEHVNDFYVKQAQKAGYRSRAAYKLIEIAERDQLFSSGMIIVDLGAAPGSWSQVCRERIGKSGKIIALDLLNMLPLDGVTFIQGDFSEEKVCEAIEFHLEGKLVDLILSDMSPNLAGIEMSDQARSINLAELALDFANNKVKPGVSFLVKIFQGSYVDQYIRDMRFHFNKVMIRKPKASRSKSKELYLLGLGKIIC